MKVFIWQGKAGLEIVDDIRGLNQAIKAAEARGAEAFDLFLKQGSKRGYRRDEQSGRWYQA